MRPSEITVREATPADDAALCELFARVTMDGDLVLAVERDPSFFQLYTQQELTAQRVFVAEAAGRLEGVATFLAREGYVDGELRTVGYLGDLRLSKVLRGGFFFGRRFGKGLRECFESAGAEVAFTAILGSNQAAMRFLTKRSKRFPDKPVYRPWCKFEITNLHFTRKRKPRRTPYEVRRATEADLPEIAARLAADHERRPFGYPFTTELLRQRLERWPGLKVEDFLLASRGGRLLGVAATWDAHSVKRFRVLDYRGSMRWVRRGFNLGATVLRYPKLPPPGEVMPYVYLTHVSVQDDDPAILRALIDRAYADLHGLGYNFITTFVMENDPMASALARYQTTPIPAQLFTVSPAGSPFNAWDPGSARPGFEMALV